MIRIIDESHKDDFIRILDNAKTIMGQDLDKVNACTGKKRRDYVIEHILGGWLRFPETENHRNLGWFHEGKLRAILLQDYSGVVKAWSVSYYFSDCNGLLGRRAGGELLDHAITEAESLDYFEYFRVIEAAKYNAFDRYAISKLKHRYTYVLDEIIPAFERPTHFLTWDWLFETSSKDVDAAIVKAFLKSEYRPKMI